MADRKPGGTPARDWVRRLCDPKYRQLVSSERERMSSRVTSLVTQDPLVRLLWDQPVATGCGISAREAERWLAIIMADRGWEPGEVGEALWSRPGAMARKPSCGREYVAEIIVSAYTIFASGEAATSPDEEVE